MTLASFLLDEGLKTRQVLSLHRFNDIYRDEVMLDLHDRLCKAWAKEINTAKARLSKEDADDALFHNPNALTATVLDKGPVKAHYGNKQVSPSVSVPLLLANEKRSWLEKQLLDASEKVLTDLISHWTEVFSYEKGNGLLGSDFRVKRDGHSVRLVLSGGEGSTVSHEAIICFVAVERGKPNTKRKAYDLICLCEPGRI